MAFAPIKWKSKIVLFKPETTYGTDANPTGAANAILMTNVQIQPMEGEDVQRNIELPWLGGQETIAAALRVVLTGEIELIGSGETGVAPGWGPIMRCLGIAEIVTPDTVPGDDTGTVEYEPISDNEESGSLHFHIGPTRHIALGMRGTAEMAVSAQGIPVLRVTMTGLFITPTDIARPTPVYTGFKKPDIASKANTPVFKINAIDFVLREFTFNLGNDVQPRLLIGLERILIVDRAESISATVEAVPLATYNPYQLAQNEVRVPIELQHGTVPGRIVEFDAASCQQQRLTGLQENQGVTEWPLSFAPLPVAGNDQWKITLR